MKYKKFDCIKCGHSWLGYAKKPKCRNCKSKMINQSEAIIDDNYLSDLKKKADVKETKNHLETGAKKIEVKPLELIEETKIENVKMVEENKNEIDESLFYGSANVENKEEEPEEVTYKCACGGDLKRGALFCHKCGSALDIDWNSI